MFDILRFLADQVKEVRRIGNKSGVIKSESLIFLRSKDYHLLFTSLKNQTCEKATFTFPYAKYFRGGFFAHFPQMGKNLNSTSEFRQMIDAEGMHVKGCYFTNS